MLCYFALVWNELDQSSSDVANNLLRQFESRSPQWQVAVRAPGLAVECCVTANAEINKIYRLHGDRGAVLGKLFDRSYNEGDIPNDVVFDEKRSVDLIKTGGRTLIDRHWGRYVAFLRDPQSPKVWVIRDPSGAIPCFVTRTRGVDIYFLRLEDCDRAGPIPFSVDREGLIGRLVFALSPGHRLTTLAEVSKLLAGECIEHCEGKRTQMFYWDPLKIVNTDVIEDRADAIRLTRQTVRTCVHAWASCFDGLLHYLSGGLDSAIVLACLKDAPTQPHIVCENKYGKAGSEEDERSYARLVAEHLQCELIETEATRGYHFRIPRGLPRSPEPIYFAYIQEARAHRFGFLRERGLSAIFSGNGGDEVFFSRGVLPSAADYLYWHGIRSALWPVIEADMAVDKVSFWRVLRKALRYGLLREPWSLRENHIRRLKRPESMDEIIPAAIREEAYDSVRLFHPLYSGLTIGLPPAKQYHAFLMTCWTDNRYTPWPSDLPAEPPQIMPLISQPVMELSLRIPLYVLRSGGRDRAIAREAFSRDLPNRIILRRSKGGGNESLEDSLSHDVDSVQRTLLDGLLAQEGYLDRSRLNEALSRTHPSRLKRHCTHIERYLVTEVWLRNSSAGAHKIAAA